MRSLVLPALVLAIVTALAQARQAPTPSPIKNGVVVRAKYLSLTAGASVTTVSPGTRLTLLVHVTPNPKMHVYAPGQDGYLPVDLSVAPNSAFSAKPPVYPPPQPFTFGPTQETVKVYAEPFLVRLDVAIASSPAMKQRAAKGDTVNADGTFKYQACDDAVCYRPETVPLTWMLHLTPATQKSEVRSQ